MKKLTIAVILMFVAMSRGWAADCSVSEFSSLITDFGGTPVQIALVPSPSPTTQILSATTATAVTNPFSSGTRFLWINCDEVMHIQVGTTPATGLSTNDFRIPPGGFWIGLRLGDVNDGTLKIAFCDIDCA